MTKGSVFTQQMNKINVERGKRARNGRYKEGKQKS